MNARQVARNAAWLLAGRIVGQGLLVVCTVLLAARLGIAGLGTYAFVVAIVFVANVATTFGTDMVLIREIAGRGNASLWGPALVLQLGLSAVAIAAIWLAAPLVSIEGPGVVTALRIYALSLVPAALYSVSGAGLRGAGRMGWYAALGVAVAGLQLAAVWMFVPAGAGVTRVAAVLLGVQCAAAAVAWAAAAAWIPAFRRIPAASRSDLLALVHATGRIGLLALAGVAYQRAGIIAVGLLGGPLQAGWFAAASRVVEASRTGHVALLGALYPALSEAHAAGVPPGARHGPLAWAWRLSSVGAVALATGLVLTGPALVAVLYGPAFAPSVAGLAILSVAIVPFALANYQSLELVAAYREGTTLRALLVSLSVLVGGLLALVPAVGWVGAAWAILAAEGVQAVLLSVSTGRAGPARAGYVVADGLP